MSFEYQEPKNAPVKDSELIADLQNISNALGISKISKSIYENNGLYNPTTYIRRFGSWNKAIEIAGLSVSNEVEISDDRLFENILQLWQTLGKQPARVHLQSKHSQFSQSPYLRRFGNWTNAIKGFVEYINENDKDNEIESAKTEHFYTGHKTCRDPNLRMRYRILKRDNFKCTVCGASPANNPGIELHLDHIIPWNNGGEAIDENIRTLCSKCNLGKSDIL